MSEPAKKWRTDLRVAIKKRGRRKYDVWTGFAPKGGFYFNLEGTPNCDHLIWMEGDPNIVKYAIPSEKFVGQGSEGPQGSSRFFWTGFSFNPGKIRLSVRYAPLHKGSEDVVKVLEATRKQGKYWQALEALFAAQPGWTEHHTARVDLVWQYLEPLGLDVERLKTDMQSLEIAPIVQQDVADLKTLNVSKTPEFFVNGRPLPKFGDHELHSPLFSQP